MGSWIDRTGGDELDIERRITAASKAFGGLKKMSSAGAWKWKWEHKLAPENYFPLPEKYSE